MNKNTVESCSNIFDYYGCSSNIPCTGKMTTIMKNSVCVVWCITETYAYGNSMLEDGFAPTTKLSHCVPGPSLKQRVCIQIIPKMRQCSKSAACFSLRNTPKQHRTVPNFRIAKHLSPNTSWNILASRSLLEEGETVRTQTDWVSMLMLGCQTTDAAVALWISKGQQT